MKRLSIILILAAATLLAGCDELNEPDNQAYRIPKESVSESR